MAASPQPDSVRKLLDSLEQRQDDHVGLTALTGRAISRSADNVHLAVRGGIVAVPIANLVDVTFVSKSQPDAVLVVVRDPSAITPLLRVKTSGVSGENIPGSTQSIELARDGEKVYTDRTFKDYIGVGTCTYTDTDTITGGQGQPDACDDSEPDNCPADDLRQ